MNKNEKIFHHHLTWRKAPLLNLLSISAPFCELDFDAVKPLILTAREKTILREYLIRGGFILLCEDVYPYSRDEFWGVKSWPVIDFLTKELPAVDHNFTFGKITEKHVLFHQYYTAKINNSERRELRDNPNSPDFTLVSHRGHPCAFVYGTYICDQEKWVTFERPFDIDRLRRPFSDVEDNGLYVNLFVYVMSH